MTHCAQGGLRNEYTYSKAGVSVYWTIFPVVLTVCPVVVLVFIKSRLFISGFVMLVIHLNFC